MDFRTPIRLSPADQQIGYDQQLLALGSCFADRIGDRMAVSKLDIQVNPLGISYNPLSLARLLTLGLEDTPPTPRYAEHLGQWCSFDLHSRFNQSERDFFESEVAFSLRKVAERLPNLEWLILTWGTAWIYYHPQHPGPVNNNHRFPTSEFTLQLAEVSEIVNTWRNLLEKLREHAPNLKVILTVSPIRHIRHTIPGNSVSKAALRLACHQLSEQEGVYYFPSFEIMMDDLRDYRFYADDMLHPTELAEAYIWEQFAASYFSQETCHLMSELESVQRALNHKARRPGSDEHQAFLKRLEGKVQRLEAQGINLGVEKSRLKSLKEQT